MAKSKDKHRCAVCWEWAESHDDWLEHAIETHGAVLNLFGFDRCIGNLCPGIEHARKLPNYGEARVPRQRAEPLPYRAHDGTLYTPVSLWSQDK